MQMDSFLMPALVVILTCGHQIHTALSPRPFDEFSGLTYIANQTYWLSQHTLPPPSNLTDVFLYLLANHGYEGHAVHPVNAPSMCSMAPWTLTEQASLADALTVYSIDHLSPSPTVEDAAISFDGFWSGRIRYNALANQAYLALHRTMPGDVDLWFHMRHQLLVYCDAAHFVVLCLVVASLILVVCIAMKQ